MNETLIIRDLNTQEYLSIWHKMRQFTIERTSSTIDEVWFVEHLPVYTQGYSGKKEHILSDTEIPIIQTDRGGQITYHGPGQLMIYTLINLRRKILSVHRLVNLLEQIIIDTLNILGLKAIQKSNAPGIYINQDKICSIGLRIKNGCSYHGLALNVDLNLSPFKNINPCGFNNIKMAKLDDFGIINSRQELIDIISLNIKNTFNYNKIDKI